MRDTFYFLHTFRSSKNSKYYEILQKYPTSQKTMISDEIKKKKKKKKKKQNKYIRDIWGKASRIELNEAS